jgi:hypothetical protein
MGAESTFIHRSVRETVRALVVGTGGLALSAYLIVNPSPFSLGLIFLLPLSFYSLYEGWRKSFVANCPGCGVELHDLQPSENRGILCGGCKRFVEGEGGRLSLTPDDEVSDQPIFGAPLSRSARFPDECCLCGAARTRDIHLSKSVVVRGERSSHTVEIAAAIPHCGAHADGAVIDFTPSAHVFFRSHRYLRAFCEANQTGPSVRTR